MAQADEPSKLSRRQVLITGASAAAAAALPAVLTGCQSNSPSAPNAQPSINRAALVNRHNPLVRSLDPFNALTVGNGTFAFTVDATGLQTFNLPDRNAFPLCTTATWAWHSNPMPADLVGQHIRYKDYDTYGRKVGYATDSRGQKPLFDYLRENPQRMHLGAIGFVLNGADGSAATADQLSAMEQTLNLWDGNLSSRFRWQDQPVTVLTVVHPEQDVLAVRVHSPLLDGGRLKIRIAFPYASPDMSMADWHSPQKHQTHAEIHPSTAEIERKLDEARYHVSAAWSRGTLQQVGPHEFLIANDGRGGAIDLVLRFSPQPSPQPLPNVEQTIVAASKHWQNFWSTGGAISLAGSADPRAMELERRIVLSQYNTALHCAGPMPPPESGLLFNTWYGKSHLEMHWWHGVHFAAWNRLPLLQRSLGWYGRVMPIARATAQRQGYAGVRWQKMVGPKGVDSPSPIAPLLIWQQPHLVYYAELCYQADPTPQTLRQWQGIVFNTADFMASYAVEVDGQYVLGPPLKPVPENTPTESTKNPTFELAYWRFGLSVAQQWAQRLGVSPNPKWAAVLEKLSPLPQDQGRYLMMEGMTDTYTQWNWEHPSLLGAYGMQPGYGVDPRIMRASLQQIMEVWQWDRCWGWDFPMAAMTAAKLGDPAMAVDALMIETVKNRYLPNGHVYQRPNLPAYLPANGGLLAAVAMMCVGTRGTSGCGWPNDGKWNAKWENLAPLL